MKGQRELYEEEDFSGKTNVQIFIGNFVNE